MEVAGLALGVVGIAGVIGAFKDAVDVFGLIADSKQLGRDYEVLESKLDIEKTILLQWADRTKLLDPNYDKRLDAASTQRAVVKILSSIHRILSDTGPLQKRYGLEKSYIDNDQQEGNVPTFIHQLAQFGEDQGQINDPRQNPADRVDPFPFSERRMKSFIADFQSLQLRMNIRQKESSKSNKLRWVVADKAKLEVLVRDLAYFTTKLHEVLPAAKNPLQDLADEDIGTERGLRELKIIFEASTGRRATVASSARQAIAKICEDRVLRRLWFRTIEERRGAIRPAHEETLGWALGPPGQGQLHWDDLGEWLTDQSSGIYWVSGKAGSGKSTFMKYLFQEQETRNLLGRWSQSLVLGEFFFSHAGTTEQKSQAGLARTLLYQILSHNRQLIAKLLPNMWKEIFDREDDTTRPVSLPSWSEMTYAFSSLQGLSEEMGQLGFCFFIDGLDEFDGQFAEAIEFIKTLAANPRVKIVLSSRPIPECVNAFSDLPSLHLHHLTRNDIVAYIQDRLGHDKYMKRLVRRHRQEAENLIQQIAEKSAGVFLWVILACRSVLSGFADCDRISELRRRVDELPPELEVLFQQMLGRVDERHKKQGARLLRMCYDNLKESGCDLSVQVSSLCLALVDDETFQAEDATRLSSQEEADFCRDMEGRLRSRCGGLLEVKLAKHGALDAVQGFAGNSVMSHDTRLIKSEVVFMHRTVYEFLEDPQVWQLECLAMPADGRSVAGYLSLLGSYQAMFTLAPTDVASQQKAQKELDSGFFWGLKSDKMVPHVEDNIFSVLLPILEIIKRRSFLPGGLFQRLAVLPSSEPGGCQHTPVLLAIETGARSFADKTLRSLEGERRPGVSCGCFPPLYHALRQPFLLFEDGGLRHRHGTMLDTKLTISTLLAQGCNPNEVIERGLTTMTPWSVWLSALDQANDLEENDKLVCADISEAFLRAGACASSGGSIIIERAFLGQELSARLRQRGEDLLNFFPGQQARSQNNKRLSTHTSIGEGQPRKTSGKRRRKN